jgi:hypothetical protein
VTVQVAVALVPWYVACTVAVAMLSSMQYEASEAPLAASAIVGLAGIAALTIW